MTHGRRPRTIAVTATIALLAIAGITAAERDHQQAQGSVAGSWTLSAEGGPHPISIRLTLEQDATKVTGTLENPHGGADFRVTGTFVDRKLALAASDGADLELSGELKEDGTMAGIISGGRGDVQWIARRTGTK